MLKLIIEDDEGRKTVVPFVRDEITIGRQEGNTIRLTERNVSRRHARLVRQNGHVLVEDLGSYNGVRINGERIQGPAQVRDGDLIQIGDYDLALQQETVQTGAPTVRVPIAPSQAAADEAPGPLAPDDLETDHPTHADEHEDDAATPPPTNQRRHATAVIRLDQVEMNRPRRLEAVASGVAPRLVVVSAEFKGQEFACLRTEMRIGRTDDNDIVLDHRSLSRTHAKVVREDSGEWRIIDMQSANGLMVNGESYAQAPLAHGDLVELGHVKLRFIGPGQSTTGLLHEAAAVKGAKKPLLLALVGAALLVAGGGAVWLLSGPSTPETPRQPLAVEQPPRQQPPTPAPAQNPATATGTQPPRPAGEPLAEKLQSAQAAIDARDFDKAVEMLEPLADSNGELPAEAEELLLQARAEQQSKQSLDLALKEFDSGRFQEAQKHLEDSEGTLAFATEHAELKEKVEAALKSPTKAANNKTPAGAARRPPAEQAKQFYDDGARLLRQRQYQEAESLLKKCIAIDPTYASCYFGVGAAKARLGHLEEGARYYREFLRLAPDHEMAPVVKKTLDDYEKQKQQGGGK